jgi:P2-related tail formation protein
MDPATTPVPFLPFLAAHRSVDLWYSDWSLARKREMVAQAPALSALKGTVAAPAAYLAYVDGAILDRVAYPARAFANRAFAGRATAEFPAFGANYLVQVATWLPARAAVAGRSFAGRAFARELNLEPFRRCLAALRVAKGPETLVRVDFQTVRTLTAGDAALAGAGFHAGQYLPRTRL